MVTLRDKFRGCIAASWIGSAMGAAVEGWSPERIADTYGVLDRLLPYRHYTADTDWERLPGTTEDGIERQRLIASAIIDRGDRIRADDLIAVWLRDLDPANMVYKQEAFDRSLLEMARAGVPPSELGRLVPFFNQISIGRASHPLGLINAGDPRDAADDTVEIGKIYARETSFALRWAGLYNACIAEACRPQASVESVLQVARDFVPYRAQAAPLYARYDTIERDLTRALELADKHSDPAAMRAEFYEFYQGGAHFPYSMSEASEVIPKGLAVFAITRGDPRRAIITAVNFGRDTDCLAAVAAGLAGALSGAAGIPQQWVDQVNHAARHDPYTNSQRTIEETADGIHAAFLARRQRLADSLALSADADYLA